MFNRITINRDICRLMEAKAIKDSKIQGFMGQLCLKWLELRKLIIDVRVVRYLDLQKQQLIEQQLIHIPLRKDSYSQKILRASFRFSGDKPNETEFMFFKIMD